MKKIFSILSLMLFMSSTVLMAASSLASYKRLNVRFKFEKTLQIVSCVQDANDEMLWYYVSYKPRIVECKNGDPMMKLVSYQKNTRVGIKNDGGIFQCGINLSLPTGALDILKKELAKKINISENKLKLAPLDMKNAKIMIYDLKGELLGDQIIAPEMGTSFADECLPIQMNLDNLDVPVAEELIKGKGGFRVYLLFDYDALTPEYSIKIIANYDKAFDYFSHDSNSSDIAKKWFLNGIRADNSLSSLREKLIESEVLEIESMSGKELADEELDIVIQPVIEKLINGLYDIKTPEKIGSAKLRKDPKEESKVMTYLCDNMVFKDEKNRKTGEFIYDFRKHYIETRKTITGGMLSLNNYSNDQRQAVFQTTDPTYWKYAFYSLPTISKALNQVDEVTLAVSFLYKGKQAEGTEKQLVKWNKKDGWVNAKNEECIGLEFPLQYFYEKSADKNHRFIDDLLFLQEFGVTYMEGNDTKIKKISSTVPVFTSSVPISTPMVGVTYIEFDANNDYLTWDKDSYKSGEYKGLKSNLTKIAIKIESKNPSSKFVANLTSKNTSTGLWVNHLFDKKTGLYITPQISATYTFYNNKLAKAINTKDLKTIVVEKEDALSEGTSIVFMDDDYMPVDKPYSYK